MPPDQLGTKKHVVILGAGFAGLELATRLSTSVADEVQVTLIDQSDSFVFGYSKLDILLGRRTTNELRLYYRDISKKSVDFRQERITSIDPGARRVETDAGTYEADILVVALGADYDPTRPPGSPRTGSSTTRSPAPSGSAMPCPASSLGRS